LMRLLHLSMGIPPSDALCRYSGENLGMGSAELLW
jgi:hypothetical protein